MNVEIMDVTPALAREWLALNTNNRNIRRGVVDRYQKDIENGAWQLNGEAIVLNGGSLLDGQHRLLACVAANKKFKSVVVFDAPGEAMQTIDQGVSRGFGDVLRWKGHTNQNNLASAIKLSWRWDNSYLMVPRHASISEGLAWLEENPRMPSACAFASRLTGAPLRLRASVGASVYLKALESDEGAATEFFDRLLDGEHIGKGEAVYALRRSLVTNAMRSHAKLNQNSILAYMIKGWNAWITGQPMEQMSWRRGERGERFPVMVGPDGAPISADQ